MSTWRTTLDQDTKETLAVILSLKGCYGKTALSESLARERGDEP